jgi:hypothetical protein
MLPTWTNFSYRAPCLQECTQPLHRPERERERERERVREREREYLFITGMSGALAPFSYLVVS